MNSDLVKWANVYPNLKDCSIQTFNEKDKEEKSFSRILPMTRANLEWCEWLQKDRPYWVYFSVNPMESWKRNKESVKKIQTWICDIDTWTKEKQLELIKNAPLPPSLVVESVHGFHLYYLAEKDLTEEEYCNWNRWLRNYYNWDAKVCRDTARVLRLPWYYHQKWEKIMVVYREDLSVKFKYSVDYMNQAFPNQTEITPWVEKQREQMNTRLDEEDSFWRKASELDSKTMLDKFSWTKWVSWDTISFKRNSSWTEQIYVNWKSTWCRIDKNWLIGSWDKGWPTWIQWLKRYWLVDRKELANELKNMFPELDEKKKEKKIDLNKLREKKKVRKSLEIPDFSWGETWLDNAIWKIARWQLVVLSWETWAGKTTFATFMARKNPNSYYFVLEDTMDNIARRYALRRAWITKDELNNHSRWAYKEDSYNRAYDMFLEQDINYLDIWEKVSVDELINAMKQLKEEWYWMFFIDNLGFVIWDWQTEAEQTADISHKLVSFCIKENVCVVLLHHFKKWDWTNKPRDISQLRGSGKLWDDSFIVANYMRQWDETVLRVLKDRNRWELKDYVMTFDRGDFIFQKEEWR